MNRIAIEIIDSTNEDGAAIQSAKISIDGLSLLEMLKQHELPYAQREGHPNIAGGYVWPPACEATRDTLFGVNSDEDKRVSLLECTCGCPGCWPFLLKIDVGVSDVIWSSFRQPHRSEGAVPGHWRYDNFGPFVFARAQYETELAKLA